MGQEFKSKVEQRIFKSAGIQHFYAYSEVKASASERAIKTTKTKIYRYFTYKQSYRYIDRLQDFAEGYNQTVHSTIDMPPEDVTQNNEETVRISTFLTDQKGDPVKIKHLRYRNEEYIYSSIRRKMERRNIHYCTMILETKYTESRIIMERILREHFINLNYRKLQ